MKRMVAVVMLLVAGAVFGENTSVSKKDGFDWVAMDLAVKVYVVQGYWLAELALENSMIWEINKRKDLSAEQKEKKAEEIHEEFRTPGTIGDMVHEIDRRYESYKSREVPLWLMMGMVHHEGWYR